MRTIKRGSTGGKRADLGGTYFRSKWEANWARYLRFLKARRIIQNWEFEPDTFEFEGIKRGSRFYTPDFKVTLKDGTIEYHEIKGYMDAASLTKIKRMAKYHPTVRLIVINGKAYMASTRGISRILPCWE